MSTARLAGCRVLLLCASSALAACTSSGPTSGGSADSASTAGAIAPQISAGQNAGAGRGAAGRAGEAAAAPLPAAGQEGGSGMSGAGGQLAGAGASGGSIAPAMDAALPDPDMQPLVPDPSWHCGLPAGIPVPESGELLFEAELETGAILDLGTTQFGARRVIPITGGTLSGPEIEASFLNGGLEWELTTGGKLEIEARNVLRAGSALIYVRTCGAAAAGGTPRVVLDFEAPNTGSYAFLNEGTWAGTRELDGDRMRLRVFKVAETSPQFTAAATLAAGDQAWDCTGPSGGVGTTPVLEAAVNIGGSLAVGASKYGRRNIIPITGGTFSGTGVAGSVIPGGADFQLTPTGGSGLQIEARYTLRTDDDELISVRNCGGGGGTKLLFETRADGPYAFLNAEGYTGTIGLRLGGVLISVFK